MNPVAVKRWRRRARRRVGGGSGNSECAQRVASHEREGEGGDRPGKDMKSMVPSTSRIDWRHRKPPSESVVPVPSPLYCRSPQAWCWQGGRPSGGSSSREYCPRTLTFVKKKHDRDHVRITEKAPHLGAQFDAGSPTPREKRTKGYSLPSSHRRFTRRAWPATPGGAYLIFRRRVGKFLVAAACVQPRAGRSRGRPS